MEWAGLCCCCCCCCCCCTCSCCCCVLYLSGEDRRDVRPVLPQAGLQPAGCVRDAQGIQRHRQVPRVPGMSHPTPPPPTRALIHPRHDGHVHVCVTCVCRCSSTSPTLRSSPTARTSLWSANPPTTQHTHIQRHKPTDRQTDRQAAVIVSWCVSVCHSGVGPWV